ncbi:MAG: thiamine pyrophosphate-binding protein [Bacillota bacterium]
MTIRGGQAIVNALAGEGVRYVGGHSGDATYEVLDGLHDRTDIKNILTRHEQGSVYMADGFNRAYGRPAFVPLVTKGPGNGNIIGALGNAHVDAVPMVVLQGQSPQALLDKGTLQEAPHLDIVRGVTKWGCRITTPTRIPEMMRRAFTTARAGRPGPVVVELPMDITSADIEEDKVPYFPAPENLAFVADPEAVKAVARAIAAAERPVLYVGHGALWSGATDVLIELAETYGIPVMTTLNGKSVFPENHPLSLGLGGYPVAVYSSPMAKAFVEKADLVIAAGTSFKEYATCQWLPLPKQTKLVHINTDYLEFGKAYPADYSLLSDIRLAFSAISHELASLVKAAQVQKRRATAEAEIATIKAKWRADWQSRLTSDEVPINPYRVTHEVMSLLKPEETILMHDAGTVRAYVAQHYLSDGPRSFIGFGGNSAMGWSVPAAIGAKLARPDKVVVDFVGDGSFGMTGMEVETAARYKVKVIYMLINNGVLNAVKMGQTGNYDKRWMWTELSGDYAKVAEGLGAMAQKVDRPDQVRPALEKALRADGPALIEVIAKPGEPLPYAGPKPPYPNRPKKK